MTHKIITRPSAEADILDQYVFIGLESPSAAERFLDAVQRTFALLAEMPNIGAAWESDSPRLKGIRHHPVGGFRNHLIFYRLRPEGVEILHVFHGARDITSLLASDEIEP